VNVPGLESVAHPNLINSYIYDYCGEMSYIGDGGPDMHDDRNKVAQITKFVMCLTRKSLKRIMRC